MTRWTIGTICAILACCAAAQAQDWTEILGTSATGGGLSGNGKGAHPAVAVDPQGRVTVVWKDGSIGASILVRRFNGSAWEALGPDSDTPGIGIARNAVDHPRVTLDAAGNPIVAFLRVTGQALSQIYVLRYAEDKWDFVGPSSAPGISGTNTADGPSVAVDPTDDQPAVCWRETSSRLVRARKWNGTDAWVDWGVVGGVTGDPAPLRNVDGLQIVVDALGRASVAWHEYSTVDTISQYGTMPGNILVKRREGGGWMGLGTSGEPLRGVNGTGSAWFSSLALDGQGNVFVAWSEESDEMIGICVKYYNGQSWVEMDGGSGMRPVFDSPSGAIRPSIVIDQRGNPAVSWVELRPTTRNEAFLVRWNPATAAWTALGGSTIAETGISRSGSTRAVDLPMLASAGQGDMCLVWQRISGNNRDVHLRRWINDAPDAPANLRQYKADGETVVGPGGSVQSNGGAVLAAELQEAPAGDSVRLHLELAKTGSAFSGQPLRTTPDGFGGAVPVTVETLESGATYHWQAWTEDGFGRTSAHVCYGTNPDDPMEVDFEVAGNRAPILGTFRPMDPLTQKEIAPGQAFFSTGRLTILGNVSDDDGDPLQFQAEILRLGIPFSGVATASSDWTSSGTAEVLSSLAPGSYHLQARTVDPYGAASAWVSFGGNDESAADFILVPNGSAGVSSIGCGVPGGAPTSLVPGLLLLLASVVRRR